MDGPDWSFFDNHVDVGAREPERAQTGATRAAGPLPTAERTQHRKRQLLPSNVGSGEVKVAVRRQRVVLEREYDLYQPSEAGGCLEMPYIGFHGSDQKRPFGRPTRAVSGRQRLQLDRIAKRGTGPVSLHVIDLRGLQHGPRKSGADDGSLCRPVRRRHAGTAAVMIGCRAADHREHAITVGLSLAQSFQDHGRATLAADIPVGGSVK